MQDVLPLSGVRVIDITHYIAGPYCTKLFADLGADVIKVERPGTGDEARRLRPLVGDHQSENSALFLYLNTNKRSIVLDLKSPEGISTLKELVQDANVLVENYSPGTLSKLGIGYPVLERINPSLVMTSISNFGQYGPYRDWQATDMTLNALSGMMLMTGNPGNPPFKLGLSQIQYSAGIAAAIATLSVYRYSKMTGHGQHIDLSLVEPFLNMLHQQLSRYVYMGALQSRGYIEKLPWVFPTKDGWAHVSQLQVLAVIKHLMPVYPQLTDPKFTDIKHWQEYLGELGEILRPWFQQKTKLEVTDALQKQGINASPVYNEEDLLNCPQLSVHQFFDEIEHPIVGKGKYPGRYFFCEQIPKIKNRPAPLLGQHTDEILKEIGNRRKNTGKTETSSRRHDSRMLPLEGIRILSTEHWAALPHSTKYLASLGAEVIVVESPARPPGDPEIRGKSQSGGLHIESGRNKKGITIDLAKPEGIELFKKLVKISDVVADNFTPRVMSNFGLDYKELKKVKPDIITLSISGFGHTGPWRNYRGYTITAEATCGLANLTGLPGEPPVRPGGTPLGDTVASLHAAFALLAALEYRNRTGKGAEIDISMVEPCTCQIGEAVVHYSYTGKMLERMGNHELNATPSGCYKCLGDDKWVTISVFNEKQWQALANIIKRPSLAKDPRFSSKEQRQKYSGEIDKYINDWTANIDNIQALEICQKAGVPAGAVLHVREVLTNEHFMNRGTFEVILMPSFLNEEDRRLHLAPPWRLSKTPASTQRVANIKLGEDNEYVFRDLLKLSNDEFKLLEAGKIIAKNLTGPMPDKGALPREYPRDEKYLQVLGLD